MLLSLVAAAAAEPYSLEAAVLAARRNAPEAAILDARREQARGDAGAVRAALFPQVSVSAMYRHNDEAIEFPNPFDPTAGMLSIQKLDVETATVNASQVLFNAGLFGRVMAADDASRAAEATRDGAQLDLSLRVATVWLSARSAGELRLAMNDAVDAATTHAKIAEAGLAAGTMTSLQVDRAEITLLDARQKLLDAERMEADLLGQLGLLVGGEATVASVDLTGGDPPAEEEVVRRALDARPELAAARAQAEAAGDGRWGIAGTWVPSVTAVGAWTTTNSPMFTDDPESWYVGVSASLPVLDGGLRFAEARRTNAQITAANANLERIEASTREEARAALRAEIAAAKALTLAKAQEETAIRAQKVAEGAFAVGGATSVEVEDALAAALSAKVGRIRAEAAWLGARWQRMRLCGEGIVG